MQFSHAADQGLPGLAGRDLHGGILPLEHVQGLSQLIPLGGALGFDGHRDDCLGEGDRLQQHRLARRTQRIARDGVPQSDDRDDVPRLGLVDLHLAFGGVDPPQLGNVFFLVFSRVQDPRVRLQFAGVDADPGQVAGSGRQHLEDQPAERLINAWLSAQVDSLFFQADALHRRHVQGARQVIGDAVQYRLDTDTVQRRTAIDGLNLQMDGGVPNHSTDQICRDGFLLERQFHQLIAMAVQPFQHGLAPELSQIQAIVGNLADFDVSALRLRIEDQHLHLDQIDDASKRSLGMCRSGADRDLNRNRAAVQTLVDFIEGRFEIGALPVHFVDERQPRHFVPICLAPDCFALGFDAFAGAEHHHCSVQNTQATLDLGREIHVAWRIEQIDVDVFPIERHTGRVDRDPAILFLGIRIGLGGAHVDHAHSVFRTAVEQHSLGDGRFPGIDMSDDPDIS
jgi:hypothetical protein